MQTRMNNPALVLSDVLTHLLAIDKATAECGLPSATKKLVHVRASQINGCSFCNDMHAREMKKAGESDERIFGVAAWRHSPYFSEAERAALDLTEAATRLADRPDPVPDDVWNEAARHYDEKALAALLVQIALINTFNRFAVATAQVAGERPR